jgi:hypothetical protein
MRRNANDIAAVNDRSTHDTGDMPVAPSHDRI